MLVRGEEVDRRSAGKIVRSESSESDCIIQGNRDSQLVDQVHGREVLAPAVEETAAWYTAPVDAAPTGFGALVVLMKK